MAKGLDVALQVLVVAYALLTLVTAGLGFADLGPVAVLMLGSVGNLLFLACAIVFGFWLADAYAWAGDGDHGKGWTVGSWYIPVGTIGTPHAPMMALWRRARGGPVTGTLWMWLAAWSAWWALSLVGVVAGIVVGVGAAFGGDPSQPAQPLWLNGLALGTAVACAIAAVGLVLCVQRLQATHVPPA